MSILNETEFLNKAANLTSPDSVWVCIKRDSNGFTLGWVVGLTSEDEQVVLSCDDEELAFKTSDDAIRFVAENHLSTTGEISVGFA